MTDKMTDKIHSDTIHSDTIHSDIIHSGRFSITKISTLWTNVLDSVVMKLMESTSGLTISFSNNVPISVSVNDKNEFDKIYGEKISILNEFDYDFVKFNELAKQNFSSIFDLFEDKNELKKKIHQHFGGNLFYMFPPCVGYCFIRYMNSLIKIKDPHELIHIDSETLSEYIKQKLI